MSRDGELVIQAVRSTAAMNPDKVDEPVWYSEEENYVPVAGLEHCYVNTHEQCPACLIGTALVTRLNIRMERLVELEGDPASRVVKDLGYFLDTAEEDWLDAVQLAQDGGKTWATSIAEADQEN